MIMGSVNRLLLGTLHRRQRQFNPFLFPVIRPHFHLQLLFVSQYSVQIQIATHVTTTSPPTHHGLDTPEIYLCMCNLTPMWGVML
jgi:hypothetical protein